MGSPAPSRRPRPWLALLALACCLPWLVTVGSGLCALRADATPAGSPCCPHCCPTADAPRSTAPAPIPTGALSCCEPFKAFLPSAAGASDPIKWLAARGPAPDLAAWHDFFGLALTSFRSPAAGDRPARPGPTPPGAFLRTVARRCFPSHAPPVPAALLS